MPYSISGIQGARSHMFGFSGVTTPENPNIYLIAPFDGCEADCEVVRQDPLSLGAYCPICRISPRSTRHAAASAERAEKLRRKVLAFRPWLTHTSGRTGAVSPRAARSEGGAPPGGPAKQPSTGERQGPGGLTEGGIRPAPAVKLTLASAFPYQLRRPATGIGRRSSVRFTAG